MIASVVWMLELSEMEAKIWQKICATIVELTHNCYKHFRLQGLSPRQCGLDPPPPHLAPGNEFHIFMQNFVCNTPPPPPPPLLIPYVNKIIIFSRRRLQLTVFVCKRGNKSRDCSAALWTGLSAVGSELLPGCLGALNWWLGLENQQ